jgi:threonyl-tRNA synthetase
MSQEVANVINPSTNNQENNNSVSDHRKIGLDQELFFFDECSPGSCFFLPNGTKIYNKLQKLIKDNYKLMGFQEVMTPNLYKKELWEISGHWQKYKENMFRFEEDNTEYGLKPMNCAGHCVMFKHRVRSYKDLPIRFADFGVLHRNEVSGSLTGLTRVRKFCQDDAHIFCMKSQIKSEMKSCLEFLNKIYGIFGFKFDIELSTRPKEYIGEIDMWNDAENQLREVLDEYYQGKEWKTQEFGGAFYGPKLDIQLMDGNGKKHQCATIQLDFNLPERFDLKYSNDVDNTDQLNAEQSKLDRPVMIHRAIYGSFERFIAILCEHYHGKWPLWLSPRQVMVIPIKSDITSREVNLSISINDYANKIYNDYVSEGFDTDIDLSNHSLNKKIRMAQQNSYNLIVVVGQKELEAGTVSVRQRDNSKLVTMSNEEFISVTKNSIQKFK